MEQTQRPADEAIETQEPVAETAAPEAEPEEKASRSDKKKIGRAHV